MIELVTNNIRRISDYLNSSNAAPKTEIDTSYDAKLVPLGHLRLRIVELVLHLLKLNKTPISSNLADSELFPKVC